MKYLKKFEIVDFEHYVKKNESFFDFFCKLINEDLKEEYPITKCEWRPDYRIDKIIYSIRFEMPDELILLEGAVHCIMDIENKYNLNIFIAESGPISSIHYFTFYLTEDDIKRLEYLQDSTKMGLM